MDDVCSSLPFRLPSAGFHEDIRGLFLFVSVCIAPTSVVVCSGLAAILGFLSPEARLVFLVSVEGGVSSPRSPVVPLLSSGVVFRVLLVPVRLLSSYFPLGCLTLSFVL